MSARVQGLGELDGLITDLQDAGPRLERDVESIFSKAGVEMKRKMQADFSRSRHFGHIARSITYDSDARRVEVGPDAARSSSAPLAGIAYFGGAHGGGGTIREPDYILEEEAKATAEWVGRAIEGLL